MGWRFLGNDMRRMSFFNSEKFCGIRKFRYGMAIIGLDETYYMCLIMLAYELDSITTISSS